MSSPILLWFRQDLRLYDNSALLEAVKQNTPILPVYILDDDNADEFKLGGASRLWLHHSLNALNKNLNGHLHVYKGDAKNIIPKIIENTGIKTVYWNRCYEPWRIQRDKAIKSTLSEQDIEVKSFNSSLLWEPWQIQTQSKTPYKVFTPFYKKGCLAEPPPPKPQSIPKDIEFVSDHHSFETELDNLGLTPKIEWDKQMLEHWDISEDGAQATFKTFLESGLKGYKEKRDNPHLSNVSRLSPYLHFGEISPRDIWHTARDYAKAHDIPERDIDHFCSELAWREFSYHLLYHFPDLPRKNLQDKFDKFPWSDPDAKKLKAWQQGQTGYPIIDAAMRELWQTGYMHNRCRMIVASFLVKNMLVHWHHGEDWFWDCLFDADLANNSASWQWVAGCGADAAPYFRIFNPILQSAKFDPEGIYIKKHVPELSQLPAKHIHAPWEAPKDILQKAGIELGQEYPKPILDLKATRERALDAYEHIKQSD